MNDRVQNYVKELRKERGLTQEELAAAIGVSRQTIISIERGRYVPSLPLALKIAGFFRCSTDEMFKLEEI
jgi:putative transcriptional regulator